jgi:hypothetical protein
MFLNSTTGCCTSVELRESLNHDLPSRSKTTRGVAPVTVRRMISSPLTKGLTMAILGLLSPIVGIFAFDITGDTSYRLIGAVFNVSNRISFNEPLTGLGYLLFVSLRFVFAYAFMRYYAGTTTGLHVLFAAIIGEIPPMIMVASLYPWAFVNQFITPLPFHLVIGLTYAILRRPVQDTTIWPEEVRSSDGTE